MKVQMILLKLVLLTCFSAAVSAEDKIGIPTKGGLAEYVFVDKIPKESANRTATLIADAITSGGSIIFAHMKKLVNPAVGDKGFTGEYFENIWRKSLQSKLAGLTEEQKQIMEKVFWAGRQSIENNQDRINIKGIKYKHFLPVKWGRETALILNSRTGILVKQTAVKYRHPSNAPDADEKVALKAFLNSGKQAEPFGEYKSIGKQQVYRHYTPIRLVKRCLKCHGQPKGEKDVLGFEKDGFAVGEVFGLTSVSLAVN